MNAIPKRYNALELNEINSYFCPISNIKANKNNTSDKWVICPMVNKPILYGACLDMQSIARDSDFNTHPFIEDFYSLSKKFQTDVVNLRKVCLAHQHKILLEDISNESYPEDISLFQELLNLVVKIEQRL